MFSSSSFCGWVGNVTVDVGQLRLVGFEDWAGFGLVGL